MTDFTNQKSMPLKNHKHANCKHYEVVTKTMSNGVCVAIELKEYGLVSYNTVVLRVKNHRLIVTGLYSATTRRQIGWWLQERLNPMTYKDIKGMYEKGLAFDFHKGITTPMTEEEKQFCRQEAHTTNTITWHGYTY